MIQNDESETLEKKKVYIYIFLHKNNVQNKKRKYISNSLKYEWFGPKH